MIAISKPEPVVEDVSGTDRGNTKIFGDLKGSMGGFGFLDALAIAFGLWWFGVDKYIRTVLIGKTILQFKTIFTSLSSGILNITKNLSSGLLNIGKNLIPSYFTNLFNAVKDVFKKSGTGQFLKGPTKKILGDSLDFVKKIASYVDAVGDFFKSVGAFFLKLKNVGSSIMTFLGPIFKPISSLFTSLGNFGSSIMKLVTPVVGFFRSIFGFFQSLSGLGRFVRLLKFAGGPFTMILFSLFDFISGFIKGFKEGGILGGLKEGAKSVILGIVAAPLDLLKDFVSWIAEMLGFKEFSKMLDSFSFSKIIGDFFDAYIKFFSDLFKDPVGTLQKVAGGALAFFSNIGQWIYEKTLKPVVDWWNSLDFGKMWNDLVDEVTKKITSLGKYIYDNTIGKILVWWNSLDFGKMWNDLVDEATKKITSLGEYIYDNTIQPIMNWWEKLDFGIDFEGMATEAWKKVKNFAQNVYDNTVKPVVDWFANLFNSNPEDNTSIADIFSSMKDLISNFGKNLLGSLASGAKKLLNIGSNDGNVAPHTHSGDQVLPANAVATDASRRSQQLAEEQRRLAAATQGGGNVIVSAPSNTEVRSSTNVNNSILGQPPSVHQVASFSGTYGVSPF